MKKKQKKQQEENGRELDLLSTYYPVDRTQKLVTASFHVDSIGELLDPPVAPGLRAPLKEDFFETCKGVVSPFPSPYCLNVEVTAKDWGSCSPREFAQTVRDAMEISQNTKRLQARRVLFLAAIFVIAGFFCSGGSALRPGAGLVRHRLFRGAVGQGVGYRGYCPIVGGRLYGFPGFIGAVGIGPQAL